MTVAVLPITMRAGPSPLGRAAEIRHERHRGGICFPFSLLHTGTGTLDPLFLNATGAGLLAALVAVRILFYGISRAECP
jgi:hypothetical protein